MPATILQESQGFWVQTGALFLSACAGVYLIWHNGKTARRRAVIDLIIQQKSDEKLARATRRVYECHDGGNSLMTLYTGPHGGQAGGGTGVSGLPQDAPLPDQSITQEQIRIEILTALNNLEFIAVGIRLGAFDEGVYKQMQYNNVIKMWKASCGFIYELRKMDGRYTLFQDFEALAKRWERKPIKNIVG